MQNLTTLIMFKFSSKKFNNKENKPIVSNFNKLTSTVTTSKHVYSNHPCECEKVAVVYY